MAKSFQFYKTSIRVRYAETDQMGFVYYGKYAEYCEVGRVEWLRNFGISYREMEEKGVMLPVRSLSINFKKPARYDDLILIKTRLEKTPVFTIEFYYEICNQEGEILTTANTSLVFVDMKKNRPTKCPDYILEKLGV
ncbi:acyl-CoA thioester hydrolase [Flavobacteriaceae bacterium MAR_2010_188]|nr:acyl-CoA thioester hydrolase [Flavobacteriaceae bacterium MAR_2010_188]